MKRIVLLRHGESIWNKENRFTGWTDVELTPRGIEEADRAGELLREEGFVFGKAYVSYLKRAVHTLDRVLRRLGQEWIPVEKTWRLNEKHYGALQGLDKSETAARYGEAQVLAWRRSYDTAPAPLEADDPRHPRFDLRYAAPPSFMASERRLIIASALVGPMSATEMSVSRRASSRVFGVAALRPASKPFM